MWARCCMCKSGWQYMALFPVVRTSVGYIESSRLARATQPDPVSKQKQKPITVKWRKAWQFLIQQKHIFTLCPKYFNCRDLPTKTDGSTRQVW